MFEKAVERLIFTSRWLMAPFYLGLIAVLAVLVIKFAPGGLSTSCRWYST